MHTGFISYSIVISLFRINQLAVCKVKKINRWSFRKKFVEVLLLPLDICISLFPSALDEMHTSKIML